MQNHRPGFIITRNNGQNGLGFAGGRNLNTGGIILGAGGEQHHYTYNTGGVERGFDTGARAEVEKRF